MDINNYILDVGTRDNNNSYLLNQTYFKIVYAMDINNQVISEKIRKTNIFEIIDYSIKNSIFDMRNIKYVFKYSKLIYNDLVIKEIVISDLNLIEVNELSKILPTPSVLEFIKFNLKFYVDNKVSHKIMCVIDE